jgi:hypothetical protein
MSTTDPDARAHTVGKLIHPIAWPLGIAGLASGAIFALLFALNSWGDDTFGAILFRYQIVTRADPQPWIDTPFGE